VEVAYLPRRRSLLLLVLVGWQEECRGLCGWAVRPAQVRPLLQGRPKWSGRFGST